MKFAVFMTPLIILYMLSACDGKKINNNENINNSFQSTNNSDTQMNVFGDIGISFIESIMDGNTSKTTGLMNSEMQGKLDGTQAKIISDDIRSKFGSLKKAIASRMDEANGYQVMTIDCHFEKGNVTFAVSIDKDSKVAGFFIK